METDTPQRPTRQRVALIELTPATMARLRDPRVVLAIVAALTGAGALLAGYIGVSGTLDPGKQLPYLISGGVGGLFLLGLAAALLFSSDVGAVREEIRDLGDRMDGLATEVHRLAAALDEQKLESAGETAPANGTTSSRPRRRSSRADAP